ncbi:hypothetical protein lerEdw1_010829 [Lerista edwardsae]|nr:hypothetical protein lerEdw1_010829 [Lerista edwardsae]
MEGDGAPVCAPPAGDGEDGTKSPARAVEPLPGRGRSLLGNWQEERATEYLDRVPRPECGSEGSFFRHGHRGLLTLQFGASLAERTTMKDSYRRPRRTGLPERGKREAMMEWLLSQKYR